MLDQPINNSGSAEIAAPVSLNFDTKGTDRDMAIVFRRVEELEKELHRFKTEKIISETQLPSELLENSGLLPHPPKKTKRGKGYRQILQSEIEEAKKHALSCAGQARWMGVSLLTYKKYSRMYGIWDPHPNEKGKKNFFDPARGKYPLTKIIAGEFNNNPGVSDWVVKKKLLRSNIVAPRCNICGYDKRRITDNKVCLLLDHKDGDSGNFKLDNLQLLCLNCTFECGRGYIRRGKHIFDPDWMQGAQIDQINSSPGC